MQLAGSLSFGWKRSPQQAESMGRPTYLLALLPCWEVYFSSVTAAFDSEVGSRLASSLSFSHCPYACNRWIYYGTLASFRSGIHTGSHLSSAFG